MGLPRWAGGSGACDDGVDRWVGGSLGAAWGPSHRPTRERGLGRGSLQSGWAPGLGPSGLRAKVGAAEALSCVCGEGLCHLHPNQGRAGHRGSGEGNPLLLKLPWQSSSCPTQGAHRVPQLPACGDPWGWDLNEDSPGGPNLEGMPLTLLPWGALAALCPSRTLLGGPPLSS